MHNHDPLRASPKFWLFILACLAPLVALAAVFVFGLSVSSTLLLLLVLACPLSHYFLMGHGGHGRAGSTPTATDIAQESSFRANR